jgi:membrane protease YdiL (CAAX protease family)
MRLNWILSKMNMKKIILFIALVFLVSWLMVALFLAFGGRWMATPVSLAFALTYMFVPMIIAIIVQKFIYKEPIKQALGISFKVNRWFVVAWLLPVIIAVAAIGVSITFPQVEFIKNPEASRIFEHFKSILPAEKLQQIEQQTASLPLHPFWFALLQGLLAGITINAIAGFGEELGWRGFLQKEMSNVGFWQSSVLIGVIWGIWHAPIILQGHNYPQNPIAGVLMMIILCVLLAPIFSYIRLKANSVIAAAILHGTLNATAGLPLIVIQGGSDLIVGVTGLSGFIVLVGVNLGLVLYDCFFAKEKIML